jgi:hypothetical protein
VRGRGYRLDVLDLRGLLYPAVEAVNPSLESLLQTCQHPTLERLLRYRLASLFPVAAAIGDGHAARIIEYNGDYILLRRQLRNGDRRLPQQH